MYLPAPQPFKLELEWLKFQAFRWIEQDGWYYGMVEGHLIKVRNSGDGIEFSCNSSEDSLKPSVQAYFRLDQEIKPVHHALSKADDTMARLVERYGSMRLLRQDPWECLVYYICSQNNSISRISEIVNTLAKNYGTPLSLDGVESRSLPTPRRLLEVGETELNCLKLGLGRGSLIYKVARDVTEGGLDLNALYRLPYAQARSLLMSYDGIGPKISDCVCLFSLDKAEAFPVDTHIAAGLWEYYQKKYTPGTKNAKLFEWVREYFGPHAGYAGQLLFQDQLRKNRYN